VTATFEDQRSYPVLWAIIDSHETVLWTFRFRCVREGDNLPEACMLWKFLGTVSWDNYDTCALIFQEEP
jgi:hypothetical protein